jgi:hypothetical protein
LLEASNSSCFLLSVVSSFCWFIALILANASRERIELDEPVREVAAIVADSSFVADVCRVECDEELLASVFLELELEEDCGGW